DPELSQQANTTNAKQHLLDDSRFAIATVKMSGDPPIRFGIFGNVCVEQIQRYPAHIRAPHLGQDVALADQNFDSKRRVVCVANEMDGQIVRKSFAVVFFLPAIVTQPLAEVAVAIEQSHGDERQTKITRRLEMI